jgi:N-acetylglucosaminyl-diphospho-decaprenol L-rhamnosyltransferase
MTSLFPSPDGNAPPDVSIVIVSYNTESLLAPALKALEAGQAELRLQVIVVDNASRDSSVEFLKKEFPNVELIENQANVGFGRANNQALPSIRGRYVLLLNTDAFVSSNTLSESVKFMDDNKRCGVLGVRVIGEDGRLKLSCCYFPTPWNAAVEMTRLEGLFPNTRFVDDVTWDHASVRACDWVPGCYYMVRREVIETVGLFDPRYFLYYEEVDHCRRVREAEWDVIYYPYTHVVHLGGESVNAFDGPTDEFRQLSAPYMESWFLYLRKHHGLISVLAIAFLTIVTDVIAALKRAFIGGSKRPQERLKHAWLVFTVLSHTRLATRSTR